MLKPTAVIFSAILTFQLGAASFQQECESGSMNVAMHIFTNVEDKWQDSVKYLADAKVEVFDKVKNCTDNKPDGTQLVDLQEKFEKDMTKCNEKLETSKDVLHKMIGKINELMTKMQCKKIVDTTKNPVSGFYGALHYLFSGLKKLRHVSIDKPWLKLLQSVLSSISKLLHSLQTLIPDKCLCSNHSKSDCKIIAGDIKTIVDAVKTSTSSYKKCIKDQKDLLYKHSTYKVLCPK